MATERPHWLIMGKMVSPPFLGCFWFDPFILAGNEDMQFEFWLHRTTDYRVSCPWASKKFPIDMMGKWCLYASSFIFDRIIIKVAGNHGRYKSSVEFDFGPNLTTYFGVTCPWVTKISHFWTRISLKPVGQSWSSYICRIIEVGEWLHKVSGQIGSKRWFPWQQKAPLTYKAKNDVWILAR